MALDLAALADKVDGETLSSISEYVKALEGQRDEARRESIDGRKTIKARLAELEQQNNALLDKLGIQSFDEVEGVKGMQDEAKQAAARVKRMEKELAEREKALLETRRSATQLQESYAIEKAMAGHDWVDRDIAEMVIRRSVKTEGDAIVFANGDKLVSLEDGVSALVADKPHLIKSPGARGSGWTGNRANQQSTPTLDTYEIYRSRAGQAQPGA